MDFIKIKISELEENKGKETGEHKCAYINVGDVKQRDSLFT